MAALQKRKDYISWDEYFMGVALLSARRSKDPSTQVGACIVNDKNKIVGAGYNGLPIGCDDDEFPWENKVIFCKQNILTSAMPSLMPYSIILVWILKAVKFIQHCFLAMNVLKPSYNRALQKLFSYQINMKALIFSKLQK
jgi:deoxycytidylate deaminase